MLWLYCTKICYTIPYPTILYYTILYLSADRAVGVERRGSPSAPPTALYVYSRPPPPQLLPNKTNVVLFCVVQKQRLSSPFPPSPWTPPRRQPMFFSFVQFSVLYSVETTQITPKFTRMFRAWAFFPATPTKNTQITPKLTKMCLGPAPPPPPPATPQKHQSFVQKQRKCAWGLPPTRPDQYPAPLPPPPSPPPPAPKNPMFVFCTADKKCSVHGASVPTRYPPRTETMQITPTKMSLLPAPPDRGHVPPCPPPATREPMFFPPPATSPKKTNSFDNANNKLLRAWRLWPYPLCHIPLLLRTDGPVWATIKLLDTFFARVEAAQHLHSPIQLPTRDLRPSSCQLRTTCHSWHVSLAIRGTLLTFFVRRRCSTVAGMPLPRRTMRLPASTDTYATIPQAADYNESSSRSCYFNGNTSSLTSLRRPSVTSGCMPAAGAPVLCIMPQIPKSKV